MCHSYSALQDGIVLFVDVGLHGNKINQPIIFSYYKN